LNRQQKIALAVGMFFVLVLSIGGLWWWALSGVTPEQGTATLCSVFIVGVCTAIVVELLEADKNKEQQGR